MAVNEPGKRPTVVQFGAGAIGRGFLGQLWCEAGYEAVFVDVRGEDAFRQGHIRGALSVPTGTAAQHADKLPKDKLIITYCA